MSLGKEAIKGWLIFKNDVDEMLPDDSEDMDIFYKDEVINGYFTRSFNNKKTNGYKRLKEIFQNDFKNDNKILVTILNKNEVRIEKIIS